MSVIREKSSSAFVAISAAVHAAAIAALIYDGALHYTSGSKIPGPPTIEILLPPMSAEAAGAPPEPEAALEAVEKLPVMTEAAEAQDAQAAVAKSDDQDAAKRAEAPAAETRRVTDAPSDAPLKDNTAAASQGAARVAGGGAPGDSADFKARIVAWIEKNKRYPDNARRRGIEGTPMVRFRIDRSGRVLTCELQQASGKHDLDRAAVDTINRAGPFPKMPGEIGGESIEFTVPIEFSMRR